MLSDSVIEEERKRKKEQSRAERNTKGGRRSERQANETFAFTELFSNSGSLSSVSLLETKKMEMKSLREMKKKEEKPKRPPSQNGERTPLKRLESD